MCIYCVCVYYGIESRISGLDFIVVFSTSASTFVHTCFTMAESPERRVLVADLQPPVSPAHGLPQLSPLSNTSAVVEDVLHTCDC